MLEAASRQNNPIHGLLARIVHEILTDQAQLPSMPDVAMRIRASMHQPNYTATTVAKAIQADPGTSAYLVRVANSALYGGATAVENIESAVIRLGMSTTRNLVTAHSMRAMFRTDCAALRKLLHKTWHDSARCAALASVVASRCPGFDADRAMLAGLLQDIGALPLFSALERQKSMPDVERMQATIDAFTSKVGVHLLTHWEFDEDIIEVVRSRMDWLRNHQKEPDLADIVLIARRHAAIGAVEMLDAPLINELPAYYKLPLGGVGPDESLEFLREAEAEVRELMQILGA